MKSLAQKLTEKIRFFVKLMYVTICDLNGQRRSQVMARNESLYVTSHVKMSPMLANIKSELIPYLERVCFQLSNDVSFMFLGGFTHE